MFFVTPKGCPNHGLKLELGKNYHSNNSIWPAVRHRNPFQKPNSGSHSLDVVSQASRDPRRQSNNCDLPFVSPSPVLLSSSMHFIGMRLQSGAAG